MKHTLSIIIFIGTLTVLFTPLHAETIYKTVDESGAAVFSDEPAQNSEKINVHPNVVDVDIPDIPTSSHPINNRSKIMQTTHGRSDGNQTIEIGTGTTRAGDLKRKIRNRTNGEGVNRPVARPAARSGGHR